MNYQISFISEESRWIHISSDYNDIDEPDTFFSLVKTIQKTVNGKISEVGDFRFKISNLPYDIVFQWDGCFGIVIDYGNEDKDAVIDFLRKFFDL